MIPVKSDSTRPAALSGWSLLLAFSFSAAFSFFILRGGWSLGFVLTAMVAEIVIWLFPSLPLPGRGWQKCHSGRLLAEQAVLTVVVLDLSLNMFLYSNIPVRVLNVLVILVLLPFQFLLATGSIQRNWAKPSALLEVAVSYFIRPFAGLTGFAVSIQRCFRKPVSDNRQQRNPTGSILLGILVALPVILAAGALLSSADAVFSQIASGLAETLFRQKAIGSVLLAIVLFPFIYSYLYTGRTNLIYLDKKGLSENINRTLSKCIRFDKVILISFLSCINLLYIVFAIIQVVYLTGAFQSQLPGNMTYAEYARSGFFELAVVIVLNALLIVWSVKANDRQGVSGKVLLVESLLLVFSSLVQWTSAMFRMGMYIDAYGLTHLRFWVTAFMIMMLVILGLLTAKAFMQKLPLFKLVAAVLLVSLIALNHLNSDALIARYNIQRYETSGRIDAKYFYSLSFDAAPALIVLLDSDSPTVRVNAAQRLNKLYSLAIDPDRQAWQAINLSEIRAEQLIRDNLPRIQRLIGTAQ